MSASNGSGDRRSAGEIRRDIEHTREELARTAAALAERADVKARAHEKVDETRARITGRMHDARAKVTGGAASARDATPDGVVQGAQQAAGAARQNPVPVALIAGVAAGMLLGYLVAVRRRRRTAPWD